MLAEAVRSRGCEGGGFFVAALPVGQDARLKGYFNAMMMPSGDVHVHCAQLLPRQAW